MVMPIMTQTLPTVIGMGVVSETTKTMFGKGKRGSGNRRGRKSKTTRPRAVKVYRGPRGGKYIMRKGRKIYI